MDAVFNPSGFCSDVFLRVFMLVWKELVSTSYEAPTCAVRADVSIEHAQGWKYRHGEIRVLCNETDSFVKSIIAKDGCLKVTVT